MSWFYEAKKPFGLRVLNYMVTSNHIHLLVIDSGNYVIPKSMQLIAGRTAQAFNKRKSRKGAFWEDRYHATAIEQGEHLMRCLVYIDLNMVRAGVVKHPSEWKMSGYNEIQSPPDRYALLDQKGLLELCEIKDIEQLKEEHRQWIEESLREEESRREAHWSESIAIGSKGFIETPYITHITPEKELLKPKNSYI